MKLLTELLKLVRINKSYPLSTKTREYLDFLLNGQFDLITYKFKYNLKINQIKLIKFKYILLRICLDLRKSDQENH